MDKTPLGTPADLDDRPCRRILAAVDFSETSARGLRCADRLARSLGVPLSVCHVLPLYVNASPLVPHYTAIPDEETERAMTAEAMGKLAIWVTEATGRAADDVDLRIRWGEPANEVVASATAAGADMIVVSNRGLGGFARMLLGSVAESVVRHAECPVLVVR